jgi:hypothetical protein
MFEWLYTGDKKFTEPFFSDTISACRSLFENAKPFKILSDLEMMNEWAPGITSLKPSAIIFHISRCGSTLLSQLLGLDETHIVLSEVPVFDEILRLPFKEKRMDIKTSDDFLDCAIKHYGRLRDGREKHLFIKSDSWHIHFYDRLRLLFPGVLFILLYRDPREVIFSQPRQRGMQSVPGIIEPGIFGFSKEQAHEPNLDNYMANVLSSYFNKMIEIINNDPLVVSFNYRDGINNIIKKISGIIDFQITNEMERMINERSLFHGKFPQQPFKENPVELPSLVNLSPVLELYRQLDDVSAQGRWLQ